MARQCLHLCPVASPRGHLPKDAHPIAVRHLVRGSRVVIVGGRNFRGDSLAVTDNAVDLRSVLEYLEAAFTAAEGCVCVSRCSRRHLEQVAIQLLSLLADGQLVGRVAGQLIVVYPNEKQLFYIINYRWTVLGYPRHTFGWINSKNLILLLVDGA